MKNLFATAIIFATVLTANATEKPATRKIDANNIHTTSKAFGVGMYQVKGTESVKLLVDTKQQLTVKITDEKGNLLNREALKSSGSMMINLSEVPSGAYFVEISNGTETITRQILKEKGLVSTEK